MRNLKELAKLTLAGGIAVCLASIASAAEWFDAGIADYESWPSDGADKVVAGAGTWHATTNATLDVENHALTVNAAPQEPLAFVPVSSNDLADVQTILFAEVSLGELAPLAHLAPAEANVKGALAAADDNGTPHWYGWVRDGATNNWVALDGAAPSANETVTVRIQSLLTNGVVKVRYEVGEDVLSINGETWLEIVAPNTSVGEVLLTGNDYALSSLSAATFVGDATVSLTFPELENVVVASVTAGGVAVEPVNGVYTVPAGTAVTVTYAAASGYVLSGSAASATYKLLDDTEVPSSDIPSAVSIASVISINEIMASNPSPDKGGITTENGLAEMDWIELYNSSSQDIDVTGWYLSDSVKKPMKAQILGSCVVPAGGYKLVWLDKTHVDPSEYTANEAWAVLKLSSSGDLIQLADANGVVVPGQSIDFKSDPQIKGYSYGPGTISYGPNAGNGPYVYMKTATPGTQNVTEGWGPFTPEVSFSEPHGYKTAAFSLALSCAADTNAVIYYTTDGTSPSPGAASTHLYEGPIAISSTTCIRAAVPIVGSVLQYDTSATYLFLDDILAQGRTTIPPASAVGFPTNQAVNSQKMLYGLDQNVVNGADRDRLLRGFTNSISTLSIVIDPSNLFDRAKGIYVNPRGEGVEWERQTMLEQIEPLAANGGGFGIPAGIRIRGGNSRNTGKPKHSLRFFFRSEYGRSSLEYSLFPGEKEVGEYDKIDLRTSQNLSWANESSTLDNFVTEVFSRDSQRDMGQPYTRSRYYNLFINGQYWGLYQTQERGDEHFGEAYLGGDSLQYDLIKTASTYINNKLSYSIECNEGTWDAWTNLFNIAVNEGFSGAASTNYYRVLGLNPDGTRNDAYPVLLNQESLMAYMLVSHFTVDKDGPTSPFSSIDKGHANNFYALRNRDDAGTVKGFVFLRHDAEISMGLNSDTAATKNPTYWGTEAQTDPTVPVGGTYDPSGLGNMKFRTVPYFTPAELHYLLMQNEDYKRAYADAFYKFFLKEDGPMTIAGNTERYTSRMAEIDDAIVCEQARWAQSGQTRATWLSACGKSLTFITNRVANMKSQYQTAGWYPSVEPPSAVNALGEPYADGDAVPEGENVFLASTSAGTIYYTLDGSDPCAADGTPSATAAACTAAGFALPERGATIKARVLAVVDGHDEWSALEEITLEPATPSDQQRAVRVLAVYSSTVGDGDTGEFIILTNILDEAISLEGLRVACVKVGGSLEPASASLTLTLGATNLAANGTLKLMQQTDWPGLHPNTGKALKITNGEVDMGLFDADGKVVQTLHFNANWWPVREYVDGKGKVKQVCACDGTGAHFVAIDFGKTVTEEQQWKPSFLPPPTEDGENAIIAAIGANGAVKDWLDDLATTSAGFTAISNFNGTAQALSTCYLVNIPPETEPQVSLVIPSIGFDAQGRVVTGGRLLVHGVETSTTVNGAVRLYYAAMLADLASSTDFIPLDPTFPLENVTLDPPAGTDFGETAFFKLKIE